MSAVKLVFLILLLHTTFLHNEAAFVVFAPSTHRAQLGENIVLPCTFKVDDPTINIQYLAISWLFQGKEVLRFDRKGTLSSPRMVINIQDTTKGIVDMEITNVTISDIGKYRCMVTYSPQKKFVDVDLNVYATPLVMIEKVEKEDKTSVALCSVTGFYPRDITVGMLKDRTIIEDSVLSAYHTNEDGTYSVNRTWKIPTDVSPKMLSCSVFHETLSPSVQKDLHLVYRGDNTITGVVVGCIVGVIILILVVVLLLYYKRKSEHQKIMVKDIESPVWIVGEKTILSCEAFHCTGDVKVTWVIKLRDGTLHEVSDMGSSDKEEEQPLMSREYQVTKELDNQKMKGHVTTKLTFIPSISRHVGSSVSCRIVHQKKSVEKIFGIESIYAKPTFVEPVQFTLSDQGDVQISVRLQGFYPQEMEVGWFFKRGQSEEKIPSEVMKGNSGDTFDLESKCSVSGELFKDPSFKVIVRWKHQSMEEPQSREMSIRDLPWRPKLQKFPIETVFQGKEVLLQCRVSDYFPDALTVKWFERKMGNQDLEEISSSQKYKITEISSHRMENQTFSSTAVLSYKRSDLSENGVEFICRVGHPSLDTPIQTSIIQCREAPTFNLNNIQGLQTWFSGQKVTLYCTASYCKEDAQVIWMVKIAGETISEIGEDEADVNSDSPQSCGYVAHSERTEVSNNRLDITSSLTFTPSICKHQNISIAFKVLCDGIVKEKTFQHKHLYEKPTASGPIKLSLTDSGEVLCSLDIEGFYPSAIHIKWNDKKASDPNRTTQNSDGTYSVHSEYKLPGRFFSHPGSVVRVSWKHGSMEDWESREMSVLDKEFPWKANVQDIPVPNLIIGRAAVLKCEVSNVFPDVLTVKWLKKEKGDQNLSPVIHSQTYTISELQPEKQKDKTFTYKLCLNFKPSISTEEGAEFICRVEHPTLEVPVEKSTGPLTIKGLSWCPVIEEVPIPHLLMERQNTLQYNISGYFPDDVTVMWYRKEKGAQEYIPLSQDKKYQIPDIQSQRQSDLTYSCTARLLFTPILADGESEIMCRVSHPSLETPIERRSGPLQVQAKPQLLDPVKTSLCDGGDVLCSLNLQNFYPKQLKLSWRSGEDQLKSKETFEENNDHTYSVYSNCTVPGKLLLNPNFSLHVTWRHKSLEKEQSQVLSWRDPGLSWCPVIEEVPIPHLLMERQNTLQYNISGYFPDAVTVMWYRKEKGAQEYIPLSQDKKYQIPDIQSQRQSDLTYSCTARLLFTPILADGESEIMCRVSHPSLETPIERRSGPLQVQAPDQKKPCIQHPQLYSGVPGPVSHHPSPQDVSNIIDHQHHPNVPAPESHHPTPHDVSNLMDHPNRYGVQAPECVYNIMDHQHQTGAPPLDPHHHPPQEVYNIMHHQNHPGVLASESQHPYPLDVYNMFSHPHYPSAPAQESHHPHLEYMNNIVSDHITPISQQHYSPLLFDEEEAMDVEDNFLQHNMVEHREEPASFHHPLPESDEMEL
ncbi:uncharacterized protein LOC143923705 isoform X2 [Lithobates pipiens]